MAYDEALAARVRSQLPAVAFDEIKMFGGLAFMLAGNMVCGVVGDDLMVRVGADNHDAALERPGARPMEFTGRPMRGMVFVDAAGHGSDAGLKRWLDIAIEFGKSLPAKQPGVKRKARR